VAPQTEAGDYQNVGDSKMNTVRSRAEEQFAAAQKKTKKSLNEKEKVLQKTREHVAHLRALRLAKETADKEAAAKN